MKRALLVIDVQNEYFTGLLPITHPTDHLGNILRAVDGAQGKMPIVFVQHHFPQAEMPFFKRGSREWELHPEIRKRHHKGVANLPGARRAGSVSDGFRLIRRLRFRLVSNAGGRAPERFATPLSEVVDTAKWLDRL